MIPNNLTRAELADFARNAATQIAAGKVKGLLPEQVLEYSAGFEADAIELAATDAEALAMRAASIAATRKGREIQKRILRRGQNVKYSMKAVHSGPEEYDAIGFDPPARVRQMIQPQTPTELIGQRLL